MMLQRDGTAVRDAWKLRVFDDKAVVEVDCEAVAAERNVETIPAAGRGVGLFGRRDAVADFGRLVFVGAIAVDFATADGPCPCPGLAELR